LLVSFTPAAALEKQEKTKENKKIYGLESFKAIIWKQSFFLFFIVFFCFFEAREAVNNFQS
jgi:hypothetical protein